MIAMPVAVTVAVMLIIKVIVSCTVTDGCADYRRSGRADYRLQTAVLTTGGCADYRRSAQSLCHLYHVRAVAS